MNTKDSRSAAPDASSLLQVADLGDVSLGYVDVGSGTPILWCHEYFGDYRSWGPQLSAFSRQNRMITYSARGYPGSSAPDDPAAYSQELMVEDVDHLLDHLGIERAVIAGLSMGGNVALNYGIRHPERCRGLVIAGCGSGSTDRAAWEAKAASMLGVVAEQGMAGLHHWMESDATRIQLKEKDPAGWAALGARLLDRSPAAAAHIYRGVQLSRPSVLSLEDQMRETGIPAIVLFGDEDEACVEPGLFMWRTLPDARLGVFPGSGHCINLEEPELFNAIVGEFLRSIGV